MASLGKIEFHGYHTAMEEVTLFNDGRNLQVRDHLLIAKDMTIIMILTVLSMKVMVLMEKDACYRSWSHPGEKEEPLISVGDLFRFSKALAML